MIEQLWSDLIEFTSQFVIPDWPCCSIVSRCSGSLTGRRFHINVLMTVKSAVLAPMPIASDNTAASVKPGLFESVRSA